MFHGGNEIVLRFVSRRGNFKNIRYGAYCQPMKRQLIKN